MDLLSQFQFSSDNGASPTATAASHVRLSAQSYSQQPQVLDHPKLIRSITIDRCSNFTSGGANGNDVNLLSQLYKARTNSGRGAELPGKKSRALTHCGRGVHFPAGP